MAIYGKNTKALSVPHDVFYGGPLAKEGVDDRCPTWDQGGLAEERKQCQDTVEGLEVPFSLGSDSNALTKLCQDHQVQHDWSG